MRAQRAAPLPVARKNWPHAPKASCRPRHPQQPRRLANPQQERRIGRAGFRQPAAAAGHAGGLTSLACTEGVIGSRSRTRDVPTLRAANRSGHEEGLQRGQKTGHDKAFAESREKFTRDQIELTKSLKSIFESLDSRREQLYLAARREIPLDHR